MKSQSLASLLLGAVFLQSATVSAQAAPAAPAAPPAAAVPPAAAPAVPAAAPSPAPATVAPAAELPLPSPRVDETAIALTPVAGGLTATQVASRAVASSQTVRAKLAEVDARRAQVDQTTIQFFPRLTVSASYTRLSSVSAALGSGALVGAANAGQLTTGACPDGGGQCVLDSQGEPVQAAAFAIVMPENQWALTAKLSVPLSDYILRLSDAAAGSKAGVRASELQAKAERLNVQASARALYYGWLHSVARVTIAEKSLERTHSRLEEAKVAYELGSITKSDLLRLEALVANTEQILLEARSFSESAERQLGILMGDHQAPHYGVGENVMTPEPAVAGTLDDLTKQALSRRLELAAMREARKALRHGASAARALRWPRLDGYADATYANPNQRFFPPSETWNGSWSVGAALTYTINDAFSAAANARELDSSEHTLAAQQAALEDGIRQEVMSFYLSRARTKGALSSARRGLVAAEEAYRVATDLFQLGRSTASDVIDAEADLLGARLAELSARIEGRITEARLRHAAADDLPAPR